jgi:phospholipid-translocating ATPase
MCSFFLGIAILQFFPKFSTISPGLVILPLLIVLGITMIKDGWEDIKRHQSDRRVNHSLVRVLSGGDWVNTNIMAQKSRTFIRGLVPSSHRKVKKLIDPEKHEMDTPPAREPTLEFDDPSLEEGDGKNSIAHWKKTMWEDVRVGDFVKILDNESFPADILICATSEEENVAFVETKNLDGETNLKSRHAVPALTHLRSAVDCSGKLNAFRIDCDKADVNMYRLNAAVLANKEKFPVDINMTLLRGTVLKNTGWVIGVVLFSGEDTKIVLNSGGTPSKRSKVERQMNPQVCVLILRFFANLDILIPAF